MQARGLGRLWQVVRPPHCEKCGHVVTARVCDVCGTERIEQTRGRLLKSHQHRW